jgi:hypothetical protein
MDYEAGGAADAMTPGRLDLVPVAEGQARRLPPRARTTLKRSARLFRFRLRPERLDMRYAQDRSAKDLDVAIERSSRGSAFLLVARSI